MMTRREKQLNLWLRYWTAGACLRDALIVCDREAKAKNSAVRRKATDEATANLLEFWSCISPAQDSLPTTLHKVASTLHKVADTLDGKRYRYVRPNDKIEEAVAAVLGVDGRNELQFLMKAMKTPFSLRQFKQKLARIKRVEPKDLKDPDSTFRRTLKRRGYKVSGKPGRP
jgi:hypothetical protein